MKEFLDQSTAPCLETLPREHEANTQGRAGVLGSLLDFSLGSFDNWPAPTVYNPSVPFEDSGRTVILGRIESRYDELSSTGLFFLDAEHKRLELCEEWGVIKGLQDPYYLGEFLDPMRPDSDPYRVFGGVKISTDRNNRIIGWRDNFYRFKGSILHRPAAMFTPFAKGLPQQKDMRFGQWPDGWIGVLPRVQNLGSDKVGGLGKIGYFETKNLNTLQADLFRFAQRVTEGQLLDGIFRDGEWGGSNQVEILSNGEMGVVGHRASKTVDTKGRTQTLHYRPMRFMFDRILREVVTGPVELGVSPADFGPSEPKRDEHEDVLFTSGIVELGGRTALIAGIKDAHVGMIEL